MTQYELLVDELSMRLEKLVKPMKIEGGDFFVDHNDYSKVVGTMVHVFRNSVDRAGKKSVTPLEEVLVWMLSRLPLSKWVARLLSVVK